MSQIGPREKRYAPDKDFSINSAMTFTFDLENWFKVTKHPIFAWFNMTLTLDLQTVFKVTAHPLTIHSVSEVGR